MEGRGGEYLGQAGGLVYVSGANTLGLGRKNWLESQRGVPGELCRGERGLGGTRQHYDGDFSRGAGMGSHGHVPPGYAAAVPKQAPDLLP